MPVAIPGDPSTFLIVSNLALATALLYLLLVHHNQTRKKGHKR